MERDPLIDRTLGGRYRLETLIGRGGFGAVYRARQITLDRPVAVKINLHLHRPDLIARFKREAQVMARLRHPGCVTLLDYGEESDGIIYMVQEFIRGTPLSHIIDATGPLTIPRAAAIVDQVLAALAAAHKVGVVHRDIKPSNIMLVTDHGKEDIRVLDFGIAKLFDSDLDETRLTDSGRVIGTPAYMAPEQIRSHEIGPPTDIYATGVLLFHLLTGCKPFLGSSVFDIYRQHLETPPPTGAHHLPDVLQHIIDRAMAKDPAARYANAQTMRDALTAALASLDDTALTAAPAAPDTIESGPPTAMATPEATPSTHTGRQDTPTPHSHIRPGYAIAAALLAAAILGAWAWTTSESPSPSSEPATALPAHSLLGRSLPDQDAAPAPDATAIPDAQPTPAIDAIVDAMPAPPAPDAAPDAAPVQKPPSIPAWRQEISRGRRAIASQKFDDAEAHFKEAARQAPKRIEPRLELGRLYYNQAKYALSARAYSEAYAIDPNNQDALFGLGRAMKALGDDKYLYLYPIKHPKGRYVKSVNKMLDLRGGPQVPLDDMP